MRTLLYEFTTTDGSKYQVWSTGENTGDVEEEEIKENILYEDENYESRII